MRYLDHVDDRIRRYVAAKEKLIALLEEERQAVIHRAVTRGLDPNVPLKPSGVEWLGDIPAHWEVTALLHKYSQSLGKMLDSKRITRVTICSPTSGTPTSSGIESTSMPSRRWTFH